MSVVAAAGVRSRLVWCGTYPPVAEAATNPKGLHMNRTRSNANPTRRISGPDPHLRDEVGMNTAEYAVGTVGACGFAGLLYQLLTSEFGRNLLQGLFDKVLTLLPF